MGSERFMCEVTCKGIREAIGQGSLEEESHNFFIDSQDEEGPSVYA